MATKRPDNTLGNIRTRKEYRKSQKNSKKRSNQQISASAHSRRQRKLKRKEARKMLKKPRRRIFPIWLRILIVLLACVAALAGGLMVGFGILGDGNPSDALKLETWQHIIDFVTRE